jgi:hypothetical protein
MATDGLLAWRLGFAFGRVRPVSRSGRRPWGPTAMALLGSPLGPLLFRPDTPRDT